MPHEQTDIENLSHQQTVLYNAIETLDIEIGKISKVRSEKRKELLALEGKIIRLNVAAKMARKA